MPYATNVTPFQALATEHRFYNGHPYDCLFVKGTFRIAHDHSLLPLLDQPPFVVNDLQEGDEEHSALAYPSDIIPFKPGTDVVFLGTAKSAGGLPAERWAAGFALYKDGQGTPILEKVVQLTGPRHWRHGLVSGWKLSDIEAVGAVKLSYTLAYGGASSERREKENDIHWPNPFGRGYLGRDKPDEALSYAAPQILEPRVDKLRWMEPVATVGLSPVDGAQQARLQFAGTYDKRWEDEVRPNIPLDMKLDFWNVVPQDQVVHPYLVGGEEVRTVGLFPADDGTFSFRLPHYQVLAIPLRGERKLDALAMNLDTVLIDLDKRHVTLRWAALFSHEEGYEEYELAAFKQEKDAGADAASGAPGTREGERA